MRSLSGPSTGKNQEGKAAEQEDAAGKKTEGQRDRGNGQMYLPAGDGMEKEGKNRG
jgi:hypothetical protein